jgi:sulfoxide reductase heme-binding subunit YedZ
MRANRLRWLKPALFVSCLLPLAWLVFAAADDRLGANPIEAITHETGLWTLRLLLVTLAITPLRYLTGWAHPLRLRRMLGLFAFFYACLHLLTYVWLDQFFVASEIIRDVMKRPFITLGFSGFLLLIPLALTSTNRMMRRLGRNWQRLHRIVYVIPALGVLHYFWLVKADIAPALGYGAVLAVLLGARAWKRAAARTAILPAGLRPVAESPQPGA